MSAMLWMNVPLMVLAFGLMAGIPLWLVARRTDWHHKPEARVVPDYLERRVAPARVRVPRSAGYASHRPMRPAAGSANS